VTGGGRNQAATARVEAALTVAAALVVACRLPYISPALLADVSLPVPTGPYTVGTTDWHITDPARDETFAPGTKRHVHVVAYYPAAGKSAALAPYLREGAAETSTFAALVRAPGAFDQLAGAPTHAWTDAPVSRTSHPLPLLLFSHGYTAPASAYAVLLEDLASHGYVVLSVVHPFESAATRRPDGTVVTLLDERGQPRQEIRDVFAEWATEDQVSAAITNATDEARQLELLRGYLTGLERTTQALERWTADLRLALEDVRRTQGRAAPAWLANRIDRNRAGVFGHSMGGVAAAAFCVHEPACAAAMNLDGSPQYGRLIDERLGRPLMMVYSARQGREKTNDAVYARAASKYYKASIAGTKHLEFSDLVLWGGPLRQRGAFGSIEPARAILLTRMLTRAFFDQELRGRRSRVLEAEKPFPEVIIRRERRDYRSLRPSAVPP
jgi:predicted dienelactone hydrolase